MSIIGLLAMIFTLPWGTYYTYHGRLYKVIGKNWGGVELGCFFFCDRQDEYILNHESGHGLQNCIWGPLFPIVIGIPSMIRYHYRNYISKKYPSKQLPDYDAIWFEGQATRWGRKYIETDRI